MDETDLHAVKIVLRDEMYPTFKFLKRRLFSIYPRFKAVIEREELFDLIPDGKKRMDQIEIARDKLKESLSLYVKGSHSAISIEQIQTDFIVSSKGTDEFNIMKTPLGEVELKESIKNISGYPSVIVHAVQAEDDKTEPEAFQRAAQSLVLLLPPRDRNSCILGSKSCKEYGTLEDVNINSSFSDMDSIGKLIQSCLVDKVVRVLQLMIYFIELFLPVEQPEELHEQEPLEITVTKALRKTIHEAKLNQEKDELGKRRDFDSGMAFYLCRNLEIQICQSLSVRYGVKRSVAHELLCKTKFDDRMKEKVEENPEIFKKSAAEIELFYNDFPERMSDDLAYLEGQTEKTFPVISKVLRKILFEINGVFRQAKVSNGSVEPTHVPIRIPEDLHTNILSTEGVYGCGFICGKLVVHAKEMSNLNELTDKIKITMRKLGRHDFVNNFEVQKVYCSRNAGITYESGKSLRVKKTQDQDAGSSVSDNYSYGTLGCFVKGKANGTNSDNDTTQMYALSCAHVFSQGCENSVEIGRTDVTYDIFGRASPELALLKEHTIDIAAVVVDATMEGKCNVHLKNCDSFEGWKSVIHEGSFSDMIEKEVYKWGSASDLTTGLITSIDYQVQGAEKLDAQYNILVENLPGSSESDFSKEGDSGTIVCFEDPIEENVIALSIINGGLYEAVTKMYLCSYSCHLHTNVKALSEKTNINFEWYE